MSYLLDTNVLSEVRKGPRADAGVWQWFNSVNSDGLYVSVLTLGEVRRGVEKLRGRDSVQAGHLEHWLVTLQHDFADRVIPISIAIAEEWGRLSAESPIPTIDGLLAATATVMDLTMVTRNIRHFSGMSPRLLNPFGNRGAVN